MRQVEQLHSDVVRRSRFLEWTSGDVLVAGGVDACSVGGDGDPCVGGGGGGARPGEFFSERRQKLGAAVERAWVEWDAGDNRASQSGGHDVPCAEDETPGPRRGGGGRGRHEFWVELGGLELSDRVLMLFSPS